MILTELDSVRLDVEFVEGTDPKPSRGPELRLRYGFGNGKSRPVCRYSRFLGADVRSDYDGKMARKFPGSGRREGVAVW